MKTTNMIIKFTIYFFRHVTSLSHTYKMPLAHKIPQQKDARHIEQTKQSPGGCTLLKKKPEKNKGDYSNCLAKWGYWAFNAFKERGVFLDKRCNRANSSEASIQAAP